MADNLPSASENTDVHNPVQRTVNRMLDVLAQTHHHKSEVMARGVAFHTLNALVDLGVRGSHEEQKQLKKSVLSSAKEQMEDEAITEESLEEHLTILVSLYRDLGVARQEAQSEGFDLPVLNMLTDLMRQNPGDRGEQAINKFVAYAMACDIPVNEAARLVEELRRERNSVLPDIRREDYIKPRRLVYEWLRDIAIGLALGIGALALLT